VGRHGVLPNLTVTVLCIIARCHPTVSVAHTAPLRAPLGLIGSPSDQVSLHTPCDIFERFGIVRSTGFCVRGCLRWFASTAPAAIDDYGDTTQSAQEINLAKIGTSV